jgi:hypothetical protein
MDMTTLSNDIDHFQGNGMGEFVIFSRIWDPFFKISLIQGGILHYNEQDMIWLSRQRCLGEY